MKFLDSHFDKLLLSTLILVFLGVTWLMQGAEWGVRTIDMLTGALIGIITGRFLHKDEPVK